MRTSAGGCLGGTPEYIDTSGTRCFLKVDRQTTSLFLPKADRRTVSGGVLGGPTEAGGLQPQLFRTLL